MSTPELLDSRAHATLRLGAAPPPPHFVQVLVPEFAAAAACCPVLFSKDTNDGRLFAGAMFGFKPGENLVGDAAERGGFEPLMLQREGFFLSGPQIAVDAGHPRFASPAGEPMFDSAGQPTPALRAVQRVLGEIHAGLEQTRAFIMAMTDLGLVEPMDIALTFTDGERLSLQGLYTVSLDRLRDVDDTAALRLFRSGHLQLAYAMALSLRHLRRLARRRNERR